MPVPRDPSEAVDETRQQNMHPRAREYEPAANPMSQPIEEDWQDER